MKKTKLKNELKIARIFAMHKIKDKHPNFFK